MNLINQCDVESPRHDSGWIHAFRAVNVIDDHLQSIARGFGVIVTGPVGTAGGGWVPSNTYPGVRAAAALEENKP